MISGVILSNGGRTADNFILGPSLKCNVLFISCLFRHSGTMDSFPILKMTCYELDRNVKEKNFLRR